MFFEIPEGTKDLLPGEAKWKKEIEDILHIILREWGYRQVVTPSYEYLKTLSQGEESRSDYFSFFSENGDTMALRNDFTTPIARLANVHLKEEPRPLRLYYVGNLFRLRRKERKREFWQAGAELIGEGAESLDAEILALAINALDRLGVVDWGIDIGHRGVLEGILEDSNLSTQVKKDIEALLLKKDYAGLKALVKKEGASEDLLTLPSLRGGVEILKQARSVLSSKKAKSALEEIEKIIEFLKPYNYKEINVDLAMVKDLSYYTGMFFECYAPGVAGIICTGGRYDKLLANFGRSEPAVGLAISIDEIIELLARTKRPEQFSEIPDLCLVYEKDRYAEAVTKAQQEREKGLSVLIFEKDIQSGEMPKAKKYLEI